MGEMPSKTGTSHVSGAHRMGSCSAPRPRAGQLLGVYRWTQLGQTPLLNCRVNIIVSEWMTE